MQDNYGTRAKKARDNDGLDFKNISHAIRVSMELKEILLGNELVFPLKEAALIKQIKEGKLDYVNEVAPLLEELNDEIEMLMKTSNLPEKVDRKYWDKFIVDTLGDMFK